MSKRIGFVRASVVALAIVVLGPAVAHAQILIICATYRNSHADTGNNVCHGTGPGCMECTIFELSTTDDEEPVDFGRQDAIVDSTAASYVPRLVDREADLPVSLAVHTGLRFTSAKKPVCDAPALFDRVRVARKERVLPAVKDRSRSRESAQVSAR